MTISTNLILSVVGGLASLVGLAYYGWQYLPKIRLSSSRGKSDDPTGEHDRQTVLAISGRLREKGNVKAADTAYRLLGEMLPETPTALYPPITPESPRTITKEKL
jgi:hypothetical protein